MQHAVGGRIARHAGAFTKHQKINAALQTCRPIKRDTFRNAKTQGGFETPGHLRQVWQRIEYPFPQLAIAAQIDGCGNSAAQKSRRQTQVWRFKRSQ